MIKGRMNNPAGKTLRGAVALDNSEESFGEPCSSNPDHRMATAPGSVIRLSMSVKGGHMKTIVFIVLTMIALIGTGAAQVSQSSTTASVSAKHLTRKQAARLINTANTPEEHRELAEYFRQEAQRQRNKEQYYMEVVATYRLHPPRLDSYRNTPMWKQDEQVADEARDQASAYDRMAYLQERFAEGLATPK